MYNVAAITERPRHELVKTASGHSLCVAILDRLSSHAEESDEHSECECEVFQSGYVMTFTTLRQNLMSDIDGPSSNFCSSMT